MIIFFSKKIIMALGTGVSETFLFDKPFSKRGSFEPARAVAHRISNPAP